MMMMATFLLFLQKRETIFQPQHFFGGKKWPKMKHLSLKVKISHKTISNVAEKEHVKFVSEKTYLINWSFLVIIFCFFMEKNEISYFFVWTRLNDGWKGIKLCSPIPERKVMPICDNLMSKNKSNFDEKNI